MTNPETRPSFDNDSGDAAFQRISDRAAGGDEMPSEVEDDLLRRFHEHQLQVLGSARGHFLVPKPVAEGDQAL